AILPDDPEMAQALKTVYGSLNNSYEPTELTRLYGQYQSGNETAAAELKDKMYEILDAVELLETLKDSDDPVKRLIVEEAQTSINKLYDMAAAIGGAMAVVSSEDPLEQVHGYYLSQAANERLSIERNPRYQIIALEGSGEDIYYSTLYAVPSDGRMRPFVTTAMNAIADFDVSQLDTSAAEIESVAISPKEGVEVRQGESFQFAAAVAAGQENLDDVIWSVEGATGQNTVISRNGVLTLDTNELSPTVTVKAVSAYDAEVYDTVEVTVLDRIYVDPTIPTNQAFGAAVLGYSGNHGVGGEPENLFDESQDGSKWCPGDNTRYNQWVAFDLGADKTISTWQTVHAGVEDPLDISSNFSLQVLKDPENVTEEQLHSNSYLGNASNWVTVAEFQGNTEDISNYEFEEPVTARYYRLYVADGCQPNVMYPATRIYECRLFGVDTATVARTHSLTVDANIVNGSVTTDASNYEEGAKVNVYVRPAEGYRLQEGSLCYNGTPMEGTSFLMPAEDVVITAVFEEDTGTEPIPVDKEALQNAVNDAAKLVEADYTPDTWAALEEALANANTVLADEEATQEAVDSALSALEAAVIGLEPAEEPEPEPGADKSVLQMAYDYAAAQDTSKLLESLKVQYDAALANAEAILAKEDATTEEVWDAIDQLFEAVWSLSFTQGDKTLLNALIARADEMMANADKYVQADWQTLVDALAAAKDVYEDGDAMDEDIQPVAENLLNAILIQRYKAEKSILESLINQANALDLSLYTAESVQAFTAALRTANVVLKDDNLTNEDQMIVDDAVESLRSAMDNLAETSAEDPKPSDGNKDDNTKPGDTDKDGGKDTTNKDPNKGPMDNNKNPATGDSGLLAIAMTAVLLASAGAFAAARRKSRI
ncbi:MAG TPA: FIVAR domain-containing protein, partial [Firmicutes bacterium]|nr:FIVAR domain-containing protein [Bacillota bacterium]